MVSRSRLRLPPDGWSLEAYPGASGGIDVLRLSDCRRWSVADPRGTPLGRLSDLAVQHDQPFPRVTHLLAGRPARAIPWEDVSRFEPGSVVADPSRAVPVGEGGELLLARDLLDSQVVDVRGKRLARVAEIELAPTDGELRAIAVDVGLAPVVRRLGLPRLARRLRSDPIAWDAIHFASRRGHEVQLRSPAAAVHHLEPAELAELVARLPVHRAEEVMRALPEERVEAARPAARERRRHSFKRVMSARRRAPS